jgi:hypothetical protein
MNSNESLECDFSLYTNSKKQQIKANSNYKIFILVLFSFILILGIILCIIYFDNNNKKNTSNEQKFQDIDNKLKEMEDKLSKYNILLNNQINEIKIENKEFKEKEGKLFDEIYFLNNQINEIKIQNKELKELIFQNDIKLQSGDYLADFLSPESEYKYMMDSTGWREFKHHINFDVKYEKKPQVIVSINQLDNDKNKNLRINVFAADIDISGFDLKVQTWDDTSICSARIAWFAFE